MLVTHHTHINYSTMSCCPVKVVTSWVAAQDFTKIVHNTFSLFIYVLFSRERKHKKYGKIWKQRRVYGCW